MALTDHMCEDSENRTYVLGRLFYLITVAAEDAAALAARSQSGKLSPSDQRDAAATLRGTGEMIEIVASAIELIDGASCGDEKCSR